MTSTLSTLEDVSALGAAIRAARRRQRMTQAELAALAGVGVRFVSDLERGKEAAHLGLAVKIARLAGLELLVIERREWHGLQRQLGTVSG